MAQALVNGNLYSSGDTGTGHMGDGGFRTELFNLINDLLTVIGNQQSTSSSTSLSISEGEKVFVLDGVASVAVGGFIVAAYQADPVGNYMYGQVTAISSNVLTMDVLVAEGEGTIDDWIMSVAGPPADLSLFNASRFARLPIIGDFTGTDYRVAKNPNQTATVTVVGDELQIASGYNSLMHTAVLWPYDVPHHKEIRVSGYFTEPASLNSQSGIGLIINPGSAGAIDTSLARSIVWRATAGALVLYHEDGTGEFGEPNPTATYGQNDLVELRVIFDTDPQFARVDRYKNDVYIDTIELDGLPADGGNVGPMVRTGSNDSVARLRTFQIDEPRGLPTSLFISSVETGYEHGTQLNPVNSMAELQALLDALHPDVKRLEVVAGGSIYGPPLTFPTNGGLEYLRISGEPGSTVDLRPGTLLSSGWSVVDTGIYSRAHVYAGVTNSDSPSGGFFDLSNPATGLTFTSYTPKASYAEMEAAQGSFYINTSTGVAYIHTLGNVDANSLSIMRTEWPYAIHGEKLSGGSWNRLELHLDNVTTSFADEMAIRIEQATVIANAVRAFGCLRGHGFGLRDCTAILTNCISNGHAGDGYSLTPLDSGGTPLTVRPRARLQGCIGSYNSQAGGAGDGLSNHRGIPVSLSDCEFNYNGKDGISAVDDIIAANFRAIGNANAGFVLSCAVSDTATAILHNAQLLNNLQAGLECTRTAAGGVTQIDMHGGLIAGHTVGLARGIYLFNSGGGGASRCVVNTYAVARTDNTTDYVADGATTTFTDLTPPGLIW